MRQLYHAIANLCEDDGFARFQSEIVHDFYQSLGQGYSSNDNEVALVQRLVDAANGKSYSPMKMHANMLHGPRSYVEFNYRDKPVTKELGDMAIISVITRSGERLFQRMCIIQNKKANGKSWNIDQEQLFLLKNFPPFTGNKGIFKHCRDVLFRNTSGCLGAFGLLNSPGEMLFASAGLVSELQRGKKSLSASDISIPMDSMNDTHQGGKLELPFLPWMGRLHPREWYCLFEEMICEYGHPFFPGSIFGATFLGNARFSRDIHDWVRNWTQLNVGEITYANGTVANAAVDAFANALMRSAGFGEMFSIPANEQFGDIHLENQMAVFAMQFDVSEFEAIKAHAYNMSPADKRTTRRIVFEHFDYIVSEWNRFQELKDG